MDVRKQPAQALPSVHEAWLPREHSLHRPRHSKHQTGALVCAVVFFGVPLLLFVLGVRPEAIENRKLTDFPSPGDGWSFFSALNPWANDNLPLRDVAIRAEGDISEGFFGEPPRFEGGGGGNSPLGPVAPPMLTPKGDGGFTSAGFPRVISGLDGWMYIGYDTEGKCRPVKSFDEVFGALQQLRAAVEKSGRKFVLVIAPDKMTMVREHLPANYVGKECAANRTPLFWRRAVAELNVVDVRQALNQAASGGQPMFFHQDSH